MTRFACKLGLAAAVLLGVVFFTAAPAQAHEYRGRVVAPRVIVRGSNYYRAPVTIYAPPVTVYAPPVTVYAPPVTVYAPPVPVVVTPAYPVYPYTPVYVPVPAPAVSVVPTGNGCR